MLRDEYLSQSSSWHDKAMMFMPIMKRAGLKGSYQTIIVVLMSAISYLSGGLMLIVPYLFYQDPYSCTQQQKFGLQCARYVCSLDNFQRCNQNNYQELFYCPEPTLETLSDKFGDFRCERFSRIISLMAAFMYFGHVIGYLVMTLVGDHIGRWVLMFSNLVIAMVGLLIVVVPSSMEIYSLEMAAVGLFLALFGIRNCQNTCYFFIAQTMTQQKRQKYSVLIQLFFGMGVLFNPLWYYLFKKWSLVFIYFYMIPLFLVIICFYFFVKDTPMCLVVRYSTKQAYEAFKFIAKINGKPFTLRQQQIQSVKKAYQLKLDQQSKDKFTMLDLFKYKSQKTLTIVATILHCTMCFQFYAPALIIDQFDLGLYVSGFVAGFSQLVAYPICYLMISKIGRQITAYVCYSVTLVCSFLLLFVWDQGSTQEKPLSNSILVLFLVFVFRFAITIEFTVFYVYFIELYPTQTRVLGTGFVSTLGALAITFAPIILHFCIFKNIPIMALCIFMSAISIYLSKLLPETLGQIPPEIIPELMDRRSQQFSQENGVELQPVKKQAESGGLERELLKQKQ